MAKRALGALAMVAWMVLMSAPSRGQPPVLPPIVGIEEGSAAARERADLFAELRVAKNTIDARKI